VTKDADSARLEVVVNALRSLAPARPGPSDGGTPADLAVLLDTHAEMYLWLDADNVARRYHAGAQAPVPPELLLGRRPSDVVPPAAAEIFRQATDRVRQSRETVAIEYSLQLDGKRRWYEARLRALPGDELLVIVRDITRRRRAELELARERALLQSILASMAEAVVVADIDGKIIMANPAADKMFGRGLVGHRPREIFADVRAFQRDGRTPFDANEWPLLQAVRGKPCDDVEMLIRRTRRNDRWLSFTGRPLYGESGELDGGFIVAHDISDMRLYQRKLETLNSQLKVESLTDPLTGLPNRRAFDRKLAEELERPGKRRRLGVLLLDLDAFKLYNDRFGHAAGDDALRITARVLEKQVRGEDMVARLGGEEFGVILRGAGRREASAIAERCRAAMEAAPWPLRQVTVSIGVAFLLQTLDAKTLLMQADQALYGAKNAGRNRVELAPPVRIVGANDLTQAGSSKRKKSAARANQSRGRR
jgi:diguanylate cyclase (GGDEF)-like protein/PAS domain S-box-containing protein